MATATAGFTSQYKAPKSAPQKHEIIQAITVTVGDKTYFVKSDKPLEFSKLRSNLNELLKDPNVKIVVSDGYKTRPVSSQAAKNALLSSEATFGISYPPKSIAQKLR